MKKLAPDSVPTREANRQKANHRSKCFYPQIATFVPTCFLRQKANLSKLGYRWIEPALEVVFKERASRFSKQIFLHHGHESVWRRFFHWRGLWRRRASSSSFSPSESNSDCHKWSQKEGRRPWCRRGGDSSKGESLARERDSILLMQAYAWVEETKKVLLSSIIMC